MERQLGRELEKPTRAKRMGTELEGLCDNQYPQLLQGLLENLQADQLRLLGVGGERRRTQHMLPCPESLQDPGEPMRWRETDVDCLQLRVQQQSVQGCMAASQTMALRPSPSSLLGVARDRVLAEVGADRQMKSSAALLSDNRKLGPTISSDPSSS